MPCCYKHCDAVIHVEEDTKGAQLRVSSSSRRWGALDSYASRTLRVTSRRRHDDTQAAVLYTLRVSPGCFQGFEDLARMHSRRRAVPLLHSGSLSHGLAVHSIELLREVYKVVGRGAGGNVQIVLLRSFTSSLPRSWRGMCCCPSMIRREGR